MTFLKAGDQIDVHQLAADLKFAYDTAQGGDALPQEVADRIARRIDALDGEDGIIQVKTFDEETRKKIETIVREEYRHPALQRNLALFGNMGKYGELIDLPLSFIMPVSVRPNEILPTQQVAERIRDGALAYGERISLDQALEIARAVERLDGNPGGGINCRASNIATPVFQRFIARQFPHLNAVAVGDATAVAVGPTNIRLEIPERFRTPSVKDLVAELQQLGIPQEQIPVAAAGMGPSASDLLDLNRQLEILRPLIGSGAQAQLDQLKTHISAIVGTMTVKDVAQAQQAEQRLLGSGLLDQLRILRVVIPNLCGQIRGGALSAEQIASLPAFLGRWATQTRTASAALAQPVGAVMQLGRSQLGATVLGQAQAAANQVVNAAPPDPRVKTAAMIGGLIVFIGAVAYFGLRNES